MEENKNESTDIVFIPLDFDECYDMKFNRNEFKKGVKYGSFLSGIVSCLFNSGLDSNEIKDILNKIIENNQINIDDK